MGAKGWLMSYRVMFALFAVFVFADIVSGHDFGEAKLYALVCVVLARVEMTAIDIKKQETS